MKNQEAWLLVALILGIFWAFCGCAMAEEYGYSYQQARWNKSLKELYPDTTPNKDKTVIVDRRVLSSKDYEADPTILIAKARPVTKEVEPPPQTLRVEAEPIYVVREEPKITVTWEED